METYATLEEFKSFLEISENDTDTLLTEILENWTDLINIELWDSLWKQTLTRRVDGIWWSIIIMENKIDSVEYVKYKIGTDSRQEVEVDYIDRNRILLLGRIPNWIGNVEIKYTKWYEEIPSDFKKFFLFYCKILLDNQESKSPTNQNSKEIKQKSLESLSITYFSPAELGQENKSFAIDYDKILKKYKNFTCYLV